MLPFRPRLTRFCHDLLAISAAIFYLIGTYSIDFTRSVPHSIYGLGILFGIGQGILFGCSESKGIRDVARGWVALSVIAFSIVLSIAGCHGVDWIVYLTGAPIFVVFVSMLVEWRVNGEDCPGIGRAWHGSLFRLQMGSVCFFSIACLLGVVAYIGMGKYPLSPLVLLCFFYQLSASLASGLCFWITTGGGFKEPLAVSTRHEMALSFRLMFAAVVFKITSIGVFLFAPNEHSPLPSMQLAMVILSVAAIATIYQANIVVTDSKPYALRNRIRSLFGRGISGSPCA